MVPLHSHQSKTTTTSWMHLTNPMFCSVLAVCTPNSAKTKNKMPLTKPYESIGLAAFMLNYSNKHDESQLTLGTPLV